MPVPNLNDHPTAWSGSALEEADIAAAATLGQYRDDPVTRAAGALSEIADQVPALAGCGGLLLGSAALGKPRLAEAAVRMLTAILVATAAKTLLKHVISRTRPRVMIEDGLYAVRPFGSRDADWQSFPSGHTADAVAMTRAFVRVFPEAWPAYAVAAGIGAVQVPRAKHYPADVVAGAAIGVVSEWATDRAIARLTRSPVSEPDDRDRELAR